MLTRIAPTPSGFLHLGNAVNFVLTWLVARQRGGQVLLRIDDLDAERKRPEYVADVFQTLDFLGLDYDLGPTGPDDFEAHWSQRHRVDRYVATLGTLVEAGAVYACALSRKQLADYGPTYPAEGRLQHVPLDAPNVAWRFRTDEPDDATYVHDFVVRRRDGLPAYQIASLTDDVGFGVTHLVRGQDLLDSTGRQRQLAERLGRAGPPVRAIHWERFLGTSAWHHPLVLAETGQKLAKSAGSGEAGPTSIRAMRLSGEGPKRVFQAVGTLLGLPPDASGTLTDLLAAQPVPDSLFAPVGTVKLA